MDKTVYLNASTQEYNQCFGDYGFEAKRIDAIADVVQKTLQDHGIDVYRNRPQWSLGLAVNDSNRAKPDLHFAIHCAAKGLIGTKIYAYVQGGEGEKAAEAIYSEIKILIPTLDEGVKFDPNLYELRNTNSPATLVEVAFSYNVEDEAWIINNIEKVGITIAKGILKYFQIEFEKPLKEYNDDIDEY